MIELKTLKGFPVNVAETAAEDVSLKFDYNDLTQAKNYYEENGYVIIRNVLTQEICDQARTLWRKEIKNALFKNIKTCALYTVLNLKNAVQNSIKHCRIVQSNSRS